MARKAFLGNKVRRLRRDHELSQVELARRLGISASYLNLIEHNERPLTLPLLLRLADHFEVDLHGFSQDSEARLSAELNELFGDPLFKEDPPAREDLSELVESAPSLCRAVITLYRAYRNAREDLNSLSERLSDDSFLSTSTHELRTLLTAIRSFAEILQDHEEIDPAERRRFVGILVGESDRLSQVVTQMLEFATGETAGLAKSTTDPSEEAADFVQAHGNYFPELEEAAESLRRDAGLAKTTSASRLVEHLSERFGLEVRLVPQPAATNPGDEGEGETLRLLLCEADPPRTRRFLIARHIALLAFGSLLETHLASQHFSSDPTAAHGRRVLSGYLAGALLMPYDDFLAAAQALRYDVERLQQRFAVSFEQVCHRLTTLQKPGAKGVPFHFLRVDIAGNISKRFSASGLRIPRYGGACPRWAVHAAFLTPARICRQVSIMPDGVTYLDIARTVVKGGYGYGKPKSCFAVGIGCATVHAADLVYSDGLNLNDTSAVVPVGVTCRLCERDDCQQRAFAPILPSLRGRVGKSPLS